MPPAGAGVGLRLRSKRNDRLQRSRAPANCRGVSPLRAGIPHAGLVPASAGRGLKAPDSHGSGYKPGRSRQDDERGAHRAVGALSCRRVAWAGARRAQPSRDRPRGGCALRRLPGSFPGRRPTRPPTLPGWGPRAASRPGDSKHSQPASSTSVAPVRRSRATEVGRTSQMVQVTPWCTSSRIAMVAAPFLPRRVRPLPGLLPEDPGAGRCCAGHRPSRRRNLARASRARAISLSVRASSIAPPGASTLAPRAATPAPLSANSRAAHAPGAPSTYPANSWPPARRMAGPRSAGRRTAAGVAGCDPATAERMAASDTPHGRRRDARVRDFGPKGRDPAG